MKSLLHPLTQIISGLIMFAIALADSVHNASTDFNDLSLLGKVMAIGVVVIVLGNAVYYLFAWILKKVS